MKWLKACSLKETTKKMMKEAMTTGLKETLGAIDAVFFFFFFSFLFFFQ